VADEDDEEKKQESIRKIAAVQDALLEAARKADPEAEVEEEEPDANAPPPEPEKKASPVQEWGLAVAIMAALILAGWWFLRFFKSGML